MSDTVLHATAIAIKSQGVLIIGPSGAGKSDLAFRLIDRGAVLISDDAVLIAIDSTPPVLKAAPNIEGKLEVRQVGIVSVDYLRSASLHIVIELSADGDRMPFGNLSYNVGNHQVPMFRLNPFETSAPLKVEYALRSVTNDGNNVFDNEGGEIIDSQV